MKSKGFLLIDQLLLFTGVMMLVSVVCSCFSSYHQLKKTVSQFQNNTYEEQLKEAYEK